MLGRVIVVYIMPWRNSFPCHRMCCGPDTLLWFALSFFFFFFSWWKKAYMSIDANLVSNPKDK